MGKGRRMGHWNVDLNERVRSARGDDAAERVTEEREEDSNNDLMK